MALSKQQKQEIVDNLTNKLTNVKSFMFVKHDGLKVSESTELRAKCRAEGVNCFAVKKTLLTLALKNLKLDDKVNLKAFDGSILAVMSDQDEVVSAKVIKDVSKELKQLSFFGGFILKNDGSFDYLAESQVKDLANLPSKLELQAKLVGTINAPVSGFVNVLAGNMRNLVNVVNAIKDKKENK